MHVGFHLADELAGVAADIVEVHFGGHELAFRIDDEGAAQSEAAAIVVHAEEAAHGTGRIGGQSVLHVLHEAFRVAPDHVSKLRVRGDSDDVCAKGGELVLLIGEVGQLSRADEGEVSGIKNEDGPFAGLLDVGERDLAEVALGRLVGFHAEVGDVAADGDGEIG